MNRITYRMVHSIFLFLLVLIILAVFPNESAMAEDAGRAEFEKLLQDLYDNGTIPTTNGNVISYGDYVDEMAEMGYFRLTPLGESQRFVFSVHFNWESATRTPNLMNSGCGLFFQGEQGTNNHLLYSLRMDGIFYFSGYKGNKTLSFIRTPYSMPTVEGEADLVAVVNGAQVKLYLDGKEVFSKDDLPVMGDLYGVAVLSGTNKDYGIRCTGKNMFVYTW